MWIIGICGSSGAGKSTLCDELKDRGFVIFDCDQIYHDLINSPSECQRAIADTFGQDLIMDQKIDRKKLGKIVFNDPEKLQQLNRISHHYVKLKLEQKIQDARRCGVNACAIDAPMLFEAGLENKCDLVCGVIASIDHQTARICKRDGISESEARNRLKNQISNSELIKKCDLILENDGDLDKIKSFCDIINLKINSKNCEE